MKTTANILVIKKGRVLLVRSRSNTNWTLPGGKHERDETHTECVLRECKEELPRTKIKLGSRLGTFKGITPNSKTPVASTVFQALVRGKITPGSEIEESKWFSKEEIKNIFVSDLVLEILRAAEFC